MPQRFLKPGLTDSGKWNACCWQVQSFYIRLITLVDDYGRYEANPKLLRGHCFALREDVKSERVSEMCQELCLNGLVQFYEVSGKQYLQITNWKETPRADKSKFPSNEATCKQMFASASKCSLPSSSSPSSPSVISPASPGVVDRSEEIYQLYPRKVGKQVALSKIRAALKKHGFDVVHSATSRFSKAWNGTSDLTYCPYPEKWFGRERFLDAPETWKANTTNGQHLPISKDDLTKYAQQ